MRFVMCAGVVVLVLATALNASAAVPRHGSLPAVSPDGRRIAFVSDRDSTWDLYVVDASGANERRLTHSATDELVPAWTSDGNSILYRVEHGDSMALRAIDLDGSNDRPLLTLPCRDVVLSHDGRRIAYTSGSWTRNRLVVADADGSNAEAITDSTAGFFNIAWSPEDGRIAVTRIDSTRALQVWVMNVDGSEARAVTRFTAKDGRPQWPAWSADGGRIAVQSGVYDREHPESSTAHVWVIDVATGRATRLAAHAKPWLDETPSWFQDRRLAFQSDRSGRMEIWVMRDDGTGARQVTR